VRSERHSSALAELMPLQRRLSPANSLPCDLLPSPGILLQRGSVPSSSTQAYPAFSLTGSGSGVEGFTLGLPDPRLAEASNKEYDDVI